MPNIWGFADDEEEDVVPSYDPDRLRHTQRLREQGETMWHSPEDLYWSDYDYDDQYDEEPVRLGDRKIVKETEKAYMCSKGYWWPKSQVVRVEDGGVLVVTPWIYEQKQLGPEPKRSPVAETRTLAELIGLKHGT